MTHGDQSSPESDVGAYPLPCRTTPIDALTPMTATSRQTLATCREARVVCLEVVAEPASATRLKRMGFCPGQPIDVLARGNPMIVRVAGTSVGLAKELARVVIVTPANATDQASDDTGRRGTAHVG